MNDKTRESKGEERCATCGMVALHYNHTYWERTHTFAPAPAPTSPLAPEMSLLVKLGSIAVHVDEMLSAKGHTYDRVAIKTLLDDEEVRAWLKAMDKMAMLPVKR